MAAEAFLERSFTIVGGDFSNAGEVSSKVKKILQEAGVHPKVIRRVTISTYEAEMNVVCYARRANAHPFGDPGGPAHPGGRRGKRDRGH